MRIAPMRFHIRNGYSPGDEWDTLSVIADQHGLLYERCFIMGFCKDYLIQIVCAAILCVIATELVPGKTVSAKLIRILCSLYLTVCVISPFVNISFSDLSEYIEQFDINAADAVEEGKKNSAIQTAAIIKANTESYILDKASSLGLSIDVEVTVSDSIPLMPVKICYMGTVAPIYKYQLQSWVEKELGIKKEHQQWK